MNLEVPGIIGLIVVGLVAGWLASQIMHSNRGLLGNLLLGLETSNSRMSRIAKNEIYVGRDVPLAEIAARIDATSNDEIVALASQLTDRDGRAVALLGDLGGRRIDASQLAA